MIDPAPGESRIDGSPGMDATVPDRVEPDPRLLYAALLGERVSSETLCRQWLAGHEGRALVERVLDGLPQPGGLEPLDRIDAHRHGADGPVRADWPPAKRVEGTVRYVAMVALALHEHGAWRSSRPAQELAPVAGMLVPLVGAEWVAALASVLRRAQVV